MALTRTEVDNLNQGDLVLYVSGTDEENRIEAEAIIDDVDDENDLVVITLKNIIFQGTSVDHARNEQLPVYPRELTLIE